MDKISAVALKSMKRVRPELFEHGKYQEKVWSEGFHGEVEILSPVVKMSKTTNKFNTVTRPNGTDEARWV